LIHFFLAHYISKGVMKSAKLIDRMVGNAETVLHHTTHSSVTTEFVTRATWRVSLVKQELL